MMLRIKQSITSLVRNPRFTVPAVLMLAGGLSFSSSCFAILEAAVFKSIPYREPSRLVQIVKRTHMSGTRSGNLSRADFALLSNRTHCFENLGYEVDAPGSLTTYSRREISITEAKISRHLLAVLGIHPAVGRTFSLSDWEPSGDRVTMLSFEVWNSAFQADIGILGKHVRVDGDDVVVIGVLPETIRHPVSVADIWIPDRSSEVGSEVKAISDKYVVARLRDQESLANAQKELILLKPIVALNLEHTNVDADKFQLLYLADQLVGSAKHILELLLTACLSIQIIASLNVGHLLLARRMSKAHDLGIKLALGSSMAGLCLDMLSETLLIGIAAILASIPLLFLMLPTAAALASTAMGAVIHPKLSISILFFCVLTGLASSLICSMGPALLLRRLDVTSLINNRWEAGSLSIRTSRVQDVLTVIQVAAAVILMLECGLLTKSVYRLSTVKLGFDSRNLSYLMLDHGSDNFPKSALTLHEAVGQLLRGRDIQSVAIGSTPLLSGATMALTIAAQANDGDWLTLPPIAFQTVDGRYFSTLGIPLFNGRTFNDRDIKGTPCVVVVNRSFGRLVWSTDNPVGKVIDSNGGYGGKRVLCQIVGVVGDSRDIALARPAGPQLFFSDIQTPGAAVQCVYVKTASHSSTSPNTVRRVLMVADPTRKIVDSNDIGALVASALSPSETRAKLLAGLALAALILAAGGVYATATYSLSGRTKEIGIRLAMGASQRNIALLIYSHYLGLAMTGILMGLAGGVALSGFFSSGLSLLELKGYDPGVFLTVPLLCMATLLVSLTAPILRAISGNPSTLFRDHTA